MTAATLIPSAIAFALFAFGIWLGRRQALARHHCPHIYVSPEELDIA